ncbi:unnamed protein product [Triticum turgidum subsp. durum]|uniref:Tobamovirus multiplication protein 2A n=1 Tax=Triticum turgidum subsp. durum TaxID=4567 RepID=A0A9R1BP37_TRITD|nr:unnamed protein product [Triticum turgidum subsp. durum]
MACRGFFECVLKLLNLVLMAVGLAMAGYGAYLLVLWLQLLPPSPPAPPPSGDLVHLGRPMLLLIDVSISDGTSEKLISAWFIFAFIGVGVILFITSIFGCAGASARSGCCLSTQVIPVDKTGNFDMIYSFLKENWRTAKWVALGAVVFEALLFTVALIVQSGNQDDYDSDDECIGPRSGVRQPLVNKQTATDPRVPNLDYRPIRNDAWSQRMRDTKQVSTGHDISRRTKKQMHNPLMLGRCNSVLVSEFTASCAITSTCM